MSMTEKEMYESKVPWFETMEELETYIEGLCDQTHDYGTCCYAVSMAAVATFQYMAQYFGITGFQAGYADMDILRRTRNMKNGFRILDYDNLLYPQYKDRFPTWDSLIDEHIEHLAKAAQEKLDKFEHAHPDVKAYWKKLIKMGEERNNVVK